MTAPDHARPDPRQVQALHAELDAVRRRLDELTPTGNPTAGASALILGAAGITAALICVLVAAAVAATADSNPNRIVAITAAVLLGSGFGYLGVQRLRAWLRRTAALQQQRNDLLARHNQLLAALGQRPPTPQQPPGATPDLTWPTRPAKFRMVIGGILAALIILSIITTAVIQNL